MYKTFIRPLLFRFDAEKVHYFVNSVLKMSLRSAFANRMAKSAYALQDSSLEREVFGIKFKNPVGLAAGFDKNAEMVDELAVLGFGFIEIGTVTPMPQPGNDKPRLFRLPADKAIINRMGFNNQGAAVAAYRLSQRKSDVIIGGNIGKNKNTPNEEALSDYLKCFEALFEVVDYFVVNVSSPNTPGLRQLQEKEPLMKILLALKEKNQELAKLNENKKPEGVRKFHQKPILLKIAPDLTNNQLDDIVEIVQSTQIEGVIATNTTVDRDNLITLQSTISAIGAGGVSGRPLTTRSTEVIRYLSQKSDKSFPIIGVGGIFSAEDAIEKIQAGASLVQVYTGFIYEGPILVNKICNRLIIRNLHKS